MIVNQELRFGFGANWRKFVDKVDEPRIVEAERSLLAYLGRDTLAGARFLDVGCGSGLFSLAARRLGAETVSFDFDPRSVECTRLLRERYFPEDAGWRVEQGSVLDPGYLGSLGAFDVVYAWGVLHHTGAMWQALRNVMLPMKPEAALFLSIYNDQGGWSRIWWQVKRIYNLLPAPARPAFTVAVALPRELRSFAIATLQGQPGQYWRAWRDEGQGRGMSRVNDLVDWIGGFPFEVAKPEEIFRFFRDHGFTLTELKTNAGSIGCNEYLFRRAPATARLAPATAAGATPHPPL